MTSGQPGELLILFSLAMTLLSGFVFLASALGKKNLYNLGIRAYIMQIVFSVAASAWLFYLFLSHNFGIEYVYSYSSSDLPIYYLISAFWAGQEGTYLLWFMIASLLGLIILKYGRQYRDWAMVFYSLINLFLLVMLMVVSPFKVSGSLPPEGAGLNPLLQDFWMVIHPPVMFIAYAMSAVPFALVMAALVKRDYSNWLKISLPIVGINSLLLLAANAMGGYWAYKTMGWGGYWAWDPVENTSFVPWVISLALIHGMILEKKFGSFRRLNILLAVLTFLLVVYGTFLTRSGVLSDFSVHSFVDLGVNAVLITFILVMLTLSAGVFLFRHHKELVGKQFVYNIYSREFALFAGMTILFLLGAVVLFWSSLPLITQYLSETPSAAEIKTYNSFAIPLAILISLFLTLSSILKYGDRRTENLRKSALLAGLLALLGAAVSVIFGEIDPAMAATIFIYIAAMAIYLFDKITRAKLLNALAYGLAGVIIAFVFGARSITNLLFIGAALTASSAFVSSIVKMIPKEISRAAATLCHFAVGLMLVGILASSAYSHGERLVLPRDQSKSTFGYDIEYQGLTGSIMQTNNEVLLTMTGKSGVKIDARPQFFYVARTDGYMKKPYIKKEVFYDLYLAPLDIQEFPDSSRLIMRKGETREIAGLSVKFIDFKMLSHGGDSGVSVGAQMEFEYNGQKASVEPVFAAGPKGFVGQPLKIFESEPYEVKIEQIMAGEGAIVISIPGAFESGPPDQLILEVSKKPAINLLWLAIIITCFGLVLSVYRRFGELSTK